MAIKQNDAVNCDIPEINERTCKTCDLIKPIIEFSFRSKFHCRSCLNERQRMARFNSPKARKKREQEEINRTTSTKVCKKCKIRKSLDEFYDYADGKMIKMARCKSCVKEKQVEYREANYEQILEKQRIYQREHKEETRERAKERYENPAYRKKLLEKQHNEWIRSPEKRDKHKKASRKSWMKHRHKISIEEWEKAIQKEKCRICTRKFTKKGVRRPVTDHCHVTGAFRGIVCSGCNTAEGMLNTPENALRLYEYMKEMELLSYQKPQVVVITSESDA